MVNSHNTGISTGLSISGSSGAGNQTCSNTISIACYFFVECDIGMGHTDLPKSLALKGDC
jgi:hypothetical protein